MDREAACPCPLQPAQLAESLSPHRSVAAASAEVRVGYAQSGSEPSERLKVFGVHGERDLSLICTRPTVVAVDGGRCSPPSAWSTVHLGVQRHIPFLKDFYIPCLT